MDDDAKLVVSNFSNEIGEFNESIYKIDFNNGVVVVNLMFILMFKNYY